MKYLKYILLVSLLIQLLASCAKDDEISMGSLKIETKVTHLTPTDVIIEFTNPNDELKISSVDMYKKFDHGELQIIGHCEVNENTCIISGLDPNTTYCFETILWQEFYKHHNTPFSEQYLTVSDPSFTFTTANTTESRLKASMASEILGSHALINIKFDSPVYEGSNQVIYNIASSKIYICSDPDGLSPVNELIINNVSADYTHDNSYAIFEINNLKPNTTYYVFAKISIYGIYKDNKFNITDLPISLTPNQFTTGANIETLNASMTTELFEYGEASLTIQIDTKDSYIVNYYMDNDLSICLDPEGLSPAQNVYAYYSHSSDNCFYYNISSLEQRTTYYVFAKCDVDKTIWGHSLYIDDVNIKLTPNSFTTL